MKGLTAVAVFVVVAVALFLRVGDLDLRPLHSDEAINATKLERLWTQGDYRYDPEEYHGPTLYYLAVPVGRVADWVRGTVGKGPDEVGMRWTAVLAGMALLGVSLCLADGLGRWGGWVSAWWVALSPAFVYFSRYFIHEMLLVLFTGIGLGAAWRYSRRQGRGWASVFGASLGLMYATKETFVFNVAAGCMGIAFLAIAEAKRGGARGTVLIGASIQVLRRWVRGVDVVWGVGWAVGVWAVLFSSFFSNGHGWVDSVRTYWIWLERAGGASPHVHPWWFYWQRIGWFHERGGPRWTEAVILGLAAIGSFWALRGLWRRSRGLGGGNPDMLGMAHEAGSPALVGFLAVYSLTLAGIYSVLPYKTPWCLLGFYHGFILLAGWAVVELLRRVGSRAGAGLILALLGLASAHLGRQAWRATREYAADFRNPHVYAHTSADLFNLLDQVREISGVAPEGKQIRVNVMVPDSGYWPLPWYLRDFTQVGWWDRLPEDAYAPIMVVASRLQGGFEEKSKQGWLMVGLFELRPRTFVELYVEAKLWERFLAARKAAREAGDGG